jgi:holo-[acyl-carrier protein] synthase
MGVVNLPSGRPTIKLTGGALMRLQAITPAGCEPRIDVTITDEGPMAQAVVVISAVPGVRSARPLAATDRGGKVDD